jgi:hypothetical protein
MHTPRAVQGGVRAATCTPLAVLVAHASTASSFFCTAASAASTSYTDHPPQWATKFCMLHEPANS